MSYLHEVVDGRRPSEIFTTKGSGEGCATIVLLYTYTESMEKNCDEEGKEMKKEGKRRKKSVAQTWLDLNSVPLGCEE